MIEVKNISKSFGNVRALTELSMNVPKGSIYGLVGPNGAGKTTIINHLTGAYKPDSGSVLIKGEDVWENTDLKKRVLCINDDWYFYPSFSMKEMAKLYAGLYPEFNRERYEKLAEILPIDENRQIRRFSKGMKKQVAFRLVLSCMPDVLILDEPLDGLDPVMRKQILSVIISDVAERQMTVLVSSHNLRELEDICDYVGIIHKGSLVAEKSLEDLKGNICKVQIAFDGEFPEELFGDEVLHTSRLGSVHTLIIKGDADAFEKRAKSFSPIVFDKVSLTLEEVFIYELGGLGYDFKQIVF